MSRSDESYWRRQAAQQDALLACARALKQMIVDFGDIEVSQESGRDCIIDARAALEAARAAGVEIEQ